ncbi:hypothetical protein [Petrimonas sulfuriphila]|uniref:hypothetical protein n=1 Tax=Petrimonas sulfuriphila TaxID=285070 RepID=UPI003EBA1BC4
MAIKGHSIIFQKEKSGSPVKDLITDFSMVCTSFPPQSSLEAKDIVTDDWVDENGEDSFEPAILPLKAYDLEIQIGYSGTIGTAETKVSDFIKYLLGHDGNGVKLKIYNSHTNIGRKGVRFVSYNPEQSQSITDDLRVFTVTFRVTDPISTVSPTYDVNNNVTGLA